MDIVSIGTDIVECVRIGRLIEQHGELFLTRIYTAREIRYCQSRKRALEHFAGRWAAKEAIIKCLGSGWSKGISWTDMEVVTEADGLLHANLCGGAKERAHTLGIGSVLISISHCRAYAVAFATAVNTLPRPARREPLP